MSVASHQCPASLMLCHIVSFSCRSHFIELSRLCILCRWCTVVLNAFNSRNMPQDSKNLLPNCMSLSVSRAVDILNDIIHLYIKKWHKVTQSSWTLEQLSLASNSDTSFSIRTCCRLVILEVVPWCVPPQIAVVLSEKIIYGASAFIRWLVSCALAADTHSLIRSSAISSQ